MKKHSHISFKKIADLLLYFSPYIVNKWYIHNNEIGKKEWSMNYRRKKMSKNNHNNSGMLKKIKRRQIYINIDKEQSRRNSLLFYLNQGPSI